ncbi:MAG TPA: TIGR03668 family PPOX class F420-dependent oxidoreductase [Candidatus Limnocylindrales bacterium]|nr:TIGR03668 family PPOX class F420-dependent oxidoreductase [Candidatus Limnocylindrales bacterium]
MSGVMTQEQRAFVAAARRATLGTIAPDGRPRLVPVCFALRPTGDGGPPVIWTPLDEKPKRSGDPRGLARVRDLLERPAVTLLVDRWDEDWTRLGWVRCLGTAALVEPQAAGGHGGSPAPPEHASAVAALRSRYPQYATHDLESRPVIRITVEHVVSWGDLAP